MLSFTAVHVGRFFVLLYIDILRLLDVLSIVNNMLYYSL